MPGGASEASSGTRRPVDVRREILDYLRRMNSLRHRPEWYSAITHNCTISIRMQRAATERLPWDWRILVNGRGDELLYERPDKEGWFLWPWLSEDGRYLMQLRDDINWYMRKP